MKRFKIVLMLLVLSSFGFGQTSISIGHDITDIGIKKTFNERIYATSNVGIALYRVGHAVEPIFYGSYYSFGLGVKMDRIDISGTYISAEAIGATDISVDIQSVNTRLKTNITSFWKSDLYGIVNYLIKIDNYAPVSKYHTSVIDNTNQLSAGIGLYSNYGKHFYTDLALFVDLLEYAPSDTSLPRFYV